MYPTLARRTLNGSVRGTGLIFLISWTIMYAAPWYARFCCTVSGCGSCALNTSVAWTCSITDCRVVWLGLAAATEWLYHWVPVEFVILVTYRLWRIFMPYPVLPFSFIRGSGRIYVKVNKWRGSLLWQKSVQPPSAKQEPHLFVAGVRKIRQLVGWRQWRIWQVVFSSFVESGWVKKVSLDNDGP